MKYCNFFSEFVVPSSVYFIFVLRYGLTCSSFQSQKFPAIPIPPSATSLVAAIISFRRCPNRPQGMTIKTVSETEEA
ncbi:hypothetical protein V1506DRAFT_549805 [Lipomyces tetrasporus]